PDGGQHVLLVVHEVSSPEVGRLEQTAGAREPVRGIGLFCDPAYVPGHLPDRFTGRRAERRPVGRICHSRGLATQLSTDVENPGEIWNARATRPCRPWTCGSAATL